jgi:hypothetical protein
MGATTGIARRLGRAGACLVRRTVDRDRDEDRAQRPIILIGLRQPLEHETSGH